MSLSFLKRSAHADQLMAGEDVVGYFEPGVEIEGKLTILAGTVRINTHLRGEVVSDGRVIVAEQGEIEAKIKAKVVSVAGKVKGSIETSQRLEIKEHGVVLGDVHTRVLIVDGGGFFDGQCHMPMPEAEKQTVDSIDPRASTSP